MKIDKTNAHIINSKDISFHDQLFLSFEYDITVKRITIKIRDVCKEKTYTVVFDCVEGFEMTGGDCFGAEENAVHILDFEHIGDKDSQLLCELKKRILLYRDEQNCKKQVEDLIQTRFTFILGNSIDILCKCIEV